MSDANVDARAALERSIRERCEAGDFDRATATALRGYGPELFGFLVSILRGPDPAAEAFSLLGEDIWRGLPKFGWASSFRTWAYTLARNAASRYGKGQHRRDRGRAPVSQLSVELAAEVRSATATYLRTEQKDRFTALREALPEEDQTLLILRVDRGLAWEDLARVMLDDPDATPEALKRESARLRKRFQLVKEKLLELGREAGLVGGDD